jgi:hypothetical protein
MPAHLRAAKASTAIVAPGVEPRGPALVCGGLPPAVRPDSNHARYPGRTPPADAPAKGN